MPSQPPPTKYIAVLALIAGLVLFVGAKLRPKAMPEVAPPPAEVRRLEILTQRRNLENLSSYFRRIAGRAAEGLVWLRGLGTSGIVWTADGVIVSGRPQRLTGGAITAGPAVVEPEVVSEAFPVVAVRVASQTALRPVLKGEAERLAPGSWVVQVAAEADGGHYYAPGVLGGLAADDCEEFRVWTIRTNIPLGESALGGGLFDMDGRLVGVVVRCGGAYTAVTPEGVDKILAAAREISGQLLRRYGFRVEPLDEETGKYFRTMRGLLVTEVWNGGCAERAGLMPGDVIQGLDDAEVREVEDLTRLILPVAYAAFDLWIRRGGKTLRVTVPAVGSEPTLSGDGQSISLAVPPSGFLIEEVAPGSRADRAALRAGDRLLSIGGRRPVNAAAAQRALSDEQTGPVFVVVQRGVRRVGVIVR